MARKNTKRSAKVPAAKAKKQPAKRSPAAKDPKSYIGRRVSKKFSDQVYSGTVSKYVARQRWWAVEYDDGDAEEMNWSELTAAMEMYDGEAGKAAAAPPPTEKDGETKDGDAPPAEKEEEAKPPQAEEAEPPSTEKVEAEPAPTEKEEAKPPSDEKDVEMKDEEVAKPSTTENDAEAKAEKEEAKPPPPKKDEGTQQSDAPLAKAEETAPEPAKEKAPEPTEEKAPEPAKKDAETKKANAPAAKATKKAEDPKSYIGKRVSKDFGGEIFGGTVSKYIAKRKLWAIRYDDGDAEQMDRDELTAAIQLNEQQG